MNKTKERIIKDTIGKNTRLILMSFFIFFSSRELGKQMENIDKGVFIISSERKI